MKPSKYSQAIFDFVTNGKGNALIQARAGSGKSTTLIKILNIIRPDKSVHFFAFGKAIVEDLKSKIPNSQNVSVSTIHSFGMRMISKNSDSRPEIDDRKYRRIFDDIYIDMKDGVDTISDARNRTMPLVDLIRLNMVNTVEDVLAMSVRYDIAATSDDCRMALAVVNIGSKDIAVIDMADMIWLPVFHKMKVDKFDFVLIDEAQDLSELQRALVLMSVKPKTGRFVAVGDDRQAIFGFAGSSVDSFNKFKSIPNTTELPLSICYRCSKSVIKLAQTIVPSIEASEFADDGHVYMDSKISDIKSGDMILCRNTYPLVKLGFQYIASGVKATIAGRDIGKNLISMITKSECTSFDDMYKSFALELTKIECDLVRTRNMSGSDARETVQYTSYLDKVDAIRFISEGCQSINELISKIGGIFSDDAKDGIILSTIHKSKGLEANNVWIIHDELMPSKHAKMPWALTQEHNLMYVAYTRAKKTLGFIRDFNAFSSAKSTISVASNPEPKVKTSVVQPTGDVVSTFVVGDIITEELKIVEVKEISTKFGSTNKYVMTGATGSIYTKLGSMQFAEIISGRGLSVGTVVKIKAPIKDINNNQYNLGMLVSTR